MYCIGDLVMHDIEDLIFLLFLLVKIRFGLFKCKCASGDTNYVYQPFKTLISGNTLFDYLVLAQFMTLIRTRTHFSLPFIIGM